MSKVVAVRKEEGSISLYKLDDGRILNRKEICNEVAGGKVEGLALFTTRDGDEAVRSNRGQYGYSLDSLPEF